MDTTIVKRPDMDIEEDIRKILATYPPLAHDRHRLIVLPWKHSACEQFSTLPRNGWPNQRSAHDG